MNSNDDLDKVPLPQGDAFADLLRMLGLDCETYQSDDSVDHMGVTVSAPNGGKAEISGVDVEHATCDKFLNQLACTLDQWHAAEHCDTDDDHEWEQTCADEQYFRRQAQHVRQMMPTVTCIARLYQPQVAGKLTASQLTEQVWRALIDCPQYTLIAGLFYLATIKADDERQEQNDE